MLKKLLLIISFVFPWALRRWLLQKIFGYEIHPTAKIGFSWVFPKNLIMEADAKIGNFNMCKNLDLIHLKANASIGNGNWITGYSTDYLDFFADNKTRKSQLIVGKHSAITHWHFIDCSDAVTIGEFSIFAGLKSQILTHSINIELSRQIAAPVSIGDYCFVGTSCVLLPNSSLPNCSVLGAKSLLNKNYSEPFRLYAGIPAREIKPLSPESLYFSRSVGYVN